MPRQKNAPEDKKLRWKWNYTLQKNGRDNQNFMEKSSKSLKRHFLGSLFAHLGDQMFEPLFWSLVHPL